MLDAEDGAPWNVARPTSDVALLALRSLGGQDRLARLPEDFQGNFAVLSLRPDATERLTAEGAEHVVMTVVEALRQLTGDGYVAGSAEADQEMQVLGAQLFRNGLGSRDLGALGHALVRSVRDGIDASLWTTGVGSSWAAVQTWLVTALVSGAQREAVLVDRAQQKESAQVKSGRTPPRGVRPRRGR